jgi:hypothetical protein
MVFFKKYVTTGEQGVFINEPVLIYEHSLSLTQKEESATEASGHELEPDGMLRFTSTPWHLGV